ncbi:MAG: S8 family serine peptidase, partial [Firmicutes bacterium]|nr:S8 family serine peptidase [Bacillota bacterium]
GIDIYSSQTGNTHWYDMGTSFAAPHVAGVAALIKSKFPHIALWRIKQIILNTAYKDVNSVSADIRNGCISGGRLDAGAAMQAASNLSTWDMPALYSNNCYGFSVTYSGATQFSDGYFEDGWKAFDGVIRANSSSNDIKKTYQWSHELSKATTSGTATIAWLQLQLPYYVNISKIEFYNRVSGSNHHTKGAYFTGTGGMALGNAFTAPNSSLSLTTVMVYGAVTNVVRLNITSGYNKTVGANEIIIYGTRV